MSDQEHIELSAKQTPLPDLLDRVPEDIVLGIPGDEPMFPSYTNIPIGKLARQAAAELRRLSAVEAENETLKKTVEALAQAVARLQQHHATAWNRGHMMGMKANEDTARRALDAVKQDAWGNTMLTEALLKAEAQRDALLEALQALYDEQEGPPLIRRHRQWQAAMDKARAAIAKAEEA